MVRGCDSRLVLLLLALLAVSPGCLRSGPGASLPDDEAMVRARAEGKAPAEAARDYFYPRKIEDYFPAMDAVGRAAESGEDWPDQLLDQRPKDGGDGRPSRTVGPLTLTEREAFGRNAWMIWCAGNEGFWDWLANNSFGGVDFLKLVDSRDRGRLFATAGLINEPEMTATGRPGPYDFGLRLSVPSDPTLRKAREAYLARAFAGLAGGPATGGGYGTPAVGGYPAPKAKAGPAAPGDEAYGSDGYTPGFPPPEIYGLSSGVIGLRLFPNPNFDRAALAHWDARRYQDDPDYFSNPKLVRPFRVGMSCAFCHASFHPLNPPRDVTDPAWENISGSIGAQYLRFRAVFSNLLTPENFVYHLLDSQPPGSLDTSLIPSDNINNPNAMNPVFAFPERAALSFANPPERLDAAGARLPSLWTDEEFAAGSVPRELLDQIPELSRSNGNPRRVPRVLFDGADSIGAYGALARVYLNIGTYYEQWIRIHRPLVGFRPQEPFLIKDCEEHSVYWNATQFRVGPMRDYFLRITPPMRLLDAPGEVDRASPLRVEEVRARAVADGRDPRAAVDAERARRVDVGRLARGRKVFARNCVVCHSSVQPEARRVALASQAEGGELWDHDPGRWLRDPDYLAWAEAAVETPEFWRGNYLSTDYRIPVTVVGTNSARAVATNGMKGHMWSDFSSASYQNLPSVGPIRYFNPYKGESGEEDHYTPRHRAEAGGPGGGGPGYYRVPTLISIWATAPLLHNNSLGLYNSDPSVEGRLAAFDDAIRKLLWPERRLLSSSYNGATLERLRRDHGLIWRTPQETYLRLPARHVPAVLGSELAALALVGERYPWLADPRWYWLPAALLGVSFLALWRLPRGAWRVLLGYGPLALGLAVGFSISFFDGRLGGLRVGPIPAGTPINLLANINPEADPADLKKAINVTLRTLAEAEAAGLDEAGRQALFREKAAPALMEVSRCPDFVMDRGHDFEWFGTMSDDDKESLIELLKTF